MSIQAHLIDSNTVRGFGSVLQITQAGVYSFLVNYTGVNNRVGFNCPTNSTIVFNSVSVKPYTPTAAELWVWNGSPKYSRQNTESATVTKWYDQSGSGNHAEQSTANAQPKLITAGVTETENGKPAMVFDGVDDWLDLDVSSFDIGSLSSFGVLTLDQTGGSMLGVALGSQLSNKRFYPVWITGGNFTFGYGSSYTLFPSSADTETHLHTLIAGSVLGGVEGFRDGSSQGTTSLSSGNDTSTRGIGGRSDGFHWNGNIQEVIVYPSDQSANRTGIETNINNHFNIY